MVVIDVGLFGGTKVGRVECEDVSMVLIVAIELIVPSREAPDVFMPDGVLVMAVGLNVPSREAPGVFIFMPDGVSVMAIGLNILSKEAPDVFIFMPNGVLIMAIESNVPIREAPNVFIFMPEMFIFQYWSIPKRGCTSDDGLGRLDKFIPEKSNELNDIGMLLSLPQVYNSTDRDVDFRNSVIGKFSLGGCVTPLCDMARLGEVGVGCAL